MAKLIQMELRRLFMSKVFYVSMAITAAVNLALQISAPIFTRTFMPETPIQPQRVSDFFAQPFGFPLVIVALIISVISFTYADIANGYVKNIAGQIPRKSDVVIAKFVAVGVHNMVFFLVSALTVVIGTLIPTAMGYETIEFDSGLGAGLLTFLIKWLLAMAMSAILLFLTTGVQNKTIATVAGIFLGTGSLNLLYFGINEGVKAIFHVGKFSVNEFMPDQLINQVNVGANVAVIHSVAVSVVCIALFAVLTVRLFNRRDIK